MGRCRTLHRAVPAEMAAYLRQLDQRYRETPPTLIGPETRLRMHFLAMIARLFGDRRAETLEAEL